MQSDRVAAIVSAVASFIIFSIWKKGRLDPFTKRRVREDGILWLCLACLLWSCTAFLQLFVAYRIMPNLTMFLASFLSLLDNACFVLVAANIDEFKDPFIVKSETREKITRGLEKVLKRVREHYILTFVLTICLGIVVGLLELANHAGYYILFDIGLSVVTIVVIMVAFYIAFTERQYLPLAWASVAVFSLLIVAQFVGLLDVPVGNALLGARLVSLLSEWRGILHAGSTASSSLIFVALIFTWLDVRITYNVPDGQDIADAHRAGSLE